MDVVLEYLAYPSTVKRGIYSIAEERTRQLEDIRGEIASMLSVESEEIIFCSGSNIRLFVNKIGSIDIGHIFPRSRITVKDLMARGDEIFTNRESRKIFSNSINSSNPSFFFGGGDIFAIPDIYVIYAKKNILANMQPLEFGGDMVESVSFEKTSFTQLPDRLEAGTPNISSILAMKPSLDFILQNYEKTENLFKYAIEELDNFIESYNLLDKSLEFPKKDRLGSILQNSKLLFKENKIYISPFNDEEEILNLKQTILK